MTKVKFILFVTVISFSQLFGQNFEKFQWTKIVSGSGSQVHFVSGNSKNDFFVETNQGRLLHIHNFKVIEVLLPPNIDFIEAHYYRISDNEFFCSIVTSEWKGEIYRIKNKIWKKYNISTVAPIRYFFKTVDNLYLIGDFGILLEFKENSWKKIKTPIENHIISAITDSNIIYLATRNDGVVKYDGKTFNFLSKNNKEKNLPSIQIIDDTLYAITNNNQIIKFFNNRTEKLRKTDKIKYFKSLNSNKFGFIERYKYFNNKKIELIFPQSFNVFESQRGIDNVHVLNDESILLFSSDGNIYISQKSNNNFFIDLATIYRVNDLPNSFNSGVSFFDANNDKINDLLVLSQNYGNFISLYRGVNNSAYANITSISNLPFADRRILHFTISDFNRDYKEDLILESRIDTLHKILMYQNLGNFIFKKTKEIILPKDLQTMGIRNLSVFDYDTDGDDDLIVTSYYGEGNLPGYVLIYKNDFWGNFNEIDTTLKSITRSWNERVLFADISNNDTLDFFNSTFWVNDHLFFGTDSGFVDKTDSHFPTQKKKETNQIELFDFDNDGDLDIITSGRNDFLRLYENNGKGYFSEITSKVFKNFLKYNNGITNSSSLNIGDFNNDCFVDIVTSLWFPDTVYSSLFINKNGKFFEETSLNLATKKTDFTFTTVADFDNDGDVDIYATTKKHNILLVNRLNNNNFIKIKLRGIVSSTSALGSKIWIYKAGKLNDSNSLIGYKQLGADLFETNRGNDLTLHFGLGKNKKCDIKVKFLSKKIVTLTNVTAGKTLVIDELPVILATIYRLPGNIYRFLIDRNNQLYIALFFISHLILILGLWYGFSKLKWSIKLTFTFTVLNLSLFWLSVYFSSLSENIYIAFITPLSVAFLITLIPLLLFLWFNRNNTKNTFIYNDKLLELVMAFSHGEWALRNLNSIILLCENPPTNWKENPEFNSKLEIRLKTFNDMTIQSIKEIINYEKLLGNSGEELSNLEITSSEISEIITQYTNETLDEINLRQLNESFSNIRYNIKELRNLVYSRFSSKPTEVINNLISNFENELVENKIRLEKRKQYPNEIPVLIKSYELGNILDNLLQNSIRFMKNSKSRIIKIELSKESPKIVLKFSNTGTPIPKEKWDAIFEQGYSESNSTGQGLYSSKELLKKYGGRIFVTISNSEITTFRIELNEGIILN